MASRLGVGYDSHVTDLARCCFMVSEEYVKLLEPAVFEPLTDEQRQLYAQPIINKVEQQQVENVQAPEPADNPNYKGIGYEKIVQALLWKLGYGDAPAEGERNTALYTMSRYLRFIVDVEAPQATGKSFVDKEFLLLMAPVIRQDEVEWQKEIQYSLAKKDGKDTENPCAQIRILEPNIGVSAFLERALYAKGKHLFTYAPEIETVLKNNKGGAWTEKNDLFRLAYDNKPWGQHRISKDSFSGKVTLYYNMVMCGTPNKCRALNGFRAGLIAYLLEGRQETERAIRFALWFAERCLHYQLQIYGEKIDALHNGTLSLQASKGNIRYLDAMPKEFTKQDLVSLRLANNESPVVKTVIYRWVKEGLVTKIGTNLWQKC